jgi:tetratricopeptide (TPR) repeat protein
VLYEELNPIRRRRLHQRIGETLEALHGQVGEAGTEADDGSLERAQGLAYHFAQAGDLARSLRYAREAARNAERVFAHDEALKFLEQARESAEALNRSDSVAEVDEAIGDIHEARGMIRPAVESYERALSRTPTPHGRAALKAKIGNAYAPVGDPRGLACLREAVAELDAKTQTSALALATALIGRYHHYRTEHSKAIEYLEHARQLAEPLDDAETLCNVYTYLAGAHQHLLLYEQSDRWARASIALGERKVFPQAVALGNEFLAENSAARGLWDQALAFAEEDHHQARRIGSLAREAWSGFARVSGLYGKGDLAGARAAALGALALCERIGEQRLGAWLDHAAALAAADLGDDEAARAHAERAWDRARELNQLVLSALALNALGYAAMRRADVPGALGWYDQYLPLVRETENGIARHLVLACAAEAFLCAGRLNAAAQLAEQAIALAEFAKAPHYVALGRRVQAQVFAARDQHPEAGRALAEAITLFERLGSRLELARALSLHGAFALRRGEREVGRADLERARHFFAAMGAARDLARAEELLRQ